MAILTTKPLARRTVLRGLGATLGLPLLDAMLPGVLAARAGRRAAGAPLPGVLRAERDGHGALAAGQRGARLRADPHPRAAGAVPRPDDRAVGSEVELELHPRGRVRLVPDRDDARRPQRGGDSGRRVDGPDSGAALRGPDAGPVARDGDGPAEQRRRLQRPVELRLHAHDLVAQRHAGAADGVESAGGVRDAVRRQRQHRLGGARGAAAAAQEPAGRGDGAAGGPQARARTAGSGQGRRLHRGRARRRAAHPADRGAAATSSCRWSPSRRARRRTSRTTWP